MKKSRKQKRIIGAAFLVSTVTFTCVGLETGRNFKIIESFNEALERSTTSYSKTFGKNYSRLSYDFDSHVLTGNWMCAIGNGDLNADKDFIKNQGNTYTAISFPSNAGPGGYTASPGAAHAINYDGAPGWYAATIYQRQDYSESDYVIKSSDWAAKGEMTNLGGRMYYQNSSKRGQLFDSSKRFGGVVQVNLPRYNNEGPSEFPYPRMIGLYSGGWDSVYNWWNKQDTFLGFCNVWNEPWADDPEFNSGSWYCHPIRMGFFDNQVYAETSSSIKSVSCSTGSFNTMTISQFKSKVASSSFNMSDYFNVRVLNTPKCVIQNSTSTVDSKFNITFNDATRQFTLEAEIPRQLVCDYTGMFVDGEGNTIPSWIKSNTMKKSETYSYDLFKSDETTWNGRRSLTLNDISGGSSFTSKNLGQVSDEDLKRLAYNAKNLLFTNLPSVNYDSFYYAVGTRNYAGGTIDITIKAKVVKNRDGFTENKTSSSTYLGGTFTLSGFKPVHQTTFIPAQNEIININSLSASASLASKKTSELTRDDLKNIIYKNINRFYSGLPESGVSLSDITISGDLPIDSTGAWSDSTNSPATGKIKITPKLNKYVTSTGSISTNTSSAPGTTIIISGFATQGATTYKSDQNVNFANAPYSSSIYRNLYGFVLQTEYAQSSLIWDLGRNLLNNPPPVDRWCGQAMMIGGNFDTITGSGTLEWVNSFGYTRDGILTESHFNPGSNSVTTTFNGLKTLPATTATANSSSTVDKLNTFPSTLTNDQIKNLVSVNSQKVITFPAGIKFVVWTGTDLVDFTEFAPCDASGNTISLDENTEYVSSLTSFNGEYDYLTIKKDVYTYIANPANITYTLKESNDYLGTATIHLSIPNAINADGKLATVEKDVALTGFKKKNTTINSANLHINKIAEQATDNELINKIVELGLVTNVNGATINASDLEIVRRDNNNITGVITADIKLKNNIAWADGTQQTEKTFDNIQFSGFTPVQATTFSTVLTVDESKFADKYAEQTTFTLEMLKNYIYNENQAAFMSNLAFDTTINNLEIVEPTYSVQNGYIKFKLRLNRFIEEGTGHLVTDRYKESEVFTLSGFKHDQLDTQLNSGDLGIHELPSVVSEETIKQQILAKGLLINPANGKSFDVNDIEIVNKDPNDVAGTITATININNSKAWTNGVVDTTKPFNGVVFTGFNKVPATDFVVTEQYDDPSTFGGILANDKYTDEQLINYILLDDAAKFITNPVINTTPDKIKIVDRVNTIEEGKIAFKIRLFRYMDETTGKIIDDGVQYKESHLFTLTGFYHENLTTSLASTNLNNHTVPSQLSNDQLAQAIINANAVTGLPLGAKLDIGDFEFVDRDNNDVLGQISVTVKINNDKTWVNGVTQPTGIFPSLIFSGFDTVPATEFVSTLEVDGASRFANVVANDDVTNDDIISFIMSDTSKFVTGLVPETTASNFSIFGRDNDTAAGKVRFKIRLNKFMDKDTGHLINGTANKDSLEFTIYNFYHKDLTTHILDGDLHVAKLPSAVVDSDIKTAIITNNLFDGIVLNETLSEEDLNVVITDYNNITGEVTCNVDVLHSKAWTNGVIDITKPFTGLVYTGFTKVEATDFAIQKRVEVDATLSEKYADDYVTDSELKEFILKNNASSFITSVVPGTNANDIELINRNNNIATGEITFELKLSKYYEKGTGHLIDGSSFIKSETFTLWNFKHTGLTTKVNGCQLDTDLIASRVEDSTIIQAILTKNLIVDPTAHKTPTAADIQIKNRTYNDVTGTITCTVVLNHGLAWINGAEQATHDFDNIIFTVTNLVPGTEFKHNLTITDDATFASIFADASYTDDMLKQYIIDNATTKFIDGMVAGTDVGDIQIIDRHNEVSTGLITFKIKLTKYMDAATGHLVSGEPGKLSNLVTLSGFKHTGLTTKVIGGDLNINQAASTISNDQIIDALFDSANGFITNTSNKKTFERSDIQIKNRDNNDVTGTISITVTLLNSTAWFDGTPDETHDFNNIQLVVPIKLPPTEYASKKTVDGCFRILWHIC